MTRFLLDYVAWTWLLLVPRHMRCKIFLVIPLDEVRLILSHSYNWSIFIVLYPGQHYVCVCVHACFHIVLHDFGISRIQITS